MPGTLVGGLRQQIRRRAGTYPWTVDSDARIGPRRFNFRSLSEQQFQELCFLVARAEFADVIQPASPDGGLDAFRPASTVATAYRGWQAKRFTQAISWPQCVQSTKAALEHYEVPWITFCFPFDLTNGQRRQFVRKLVEAFSETKFDWWGESELQARLIGSPEGHRIANYLFGEPEGGREEMLRAVRTGGELRTAQQALERMEPVGEFFRSGDPYFSYQTGHRTHGDVASAPPPGTVMRLELATGGGISHVDVRPAIPEALERHGPAGRLLFKGVDGQHALRQLDRIRKRGGEVTFERGVEWVWDRVPPAVRDLVDSAEDGSVTLSAEPLVPVLRLTLVAATDRAREEIHYDLVASDQKTDHSEATLEDTVGGLTLMLGVRGTPPSPEMRFDWSWSMDDSPATEQAQALAFADALHGEGTLAIIDRNSDQAIATATVRASEPNPTLRSTKQLFNAIVEVERWTERTFAIPESISREEATAIIWSARLVAGVHQTWTAACFDLDRWPDANVRRGGVLQMRRSLALQVFGEQIELGEEVTYLSAYVIDTIKRRDDGRYMVHIKPHGSEGESLVRLERTGDPTNPEWSRPKPNNFIGDADMTHGSAPRECATPPPPSSRTKDSGESVEL